MARLTAQSPALATLDDAPASSSRPLLALVLWMAAAAAFALAGGFRHVPAQAVPVAIMGPFAVFLALYWRNAGVRRAVAAVPLGWLVGYHIVRAPIGFEFLRLYDAGSLPAAFAVTAGVGDLIAGGLALLALGLVGLRTRAQRRLLWLWNALALFDIVLVIATAQRLILFEHNTQMYATMGSVPYGLIPALVVPLVLMTHFAIFARLRRAADA